MPQSENLKKTSVQRAGLRRDSEHVYRKTMLFRDMKFAVSVCLPASRRLVRSPLSFAATTVVPCESLGMVGCTLGDACCDRLQYETTNFNTCTATPVQRCTTGVAPRRYYLHRTQSNDFIATYTFQLKQWPGATYGSMHLTPEAAVKYPFQRRTGIELNHTVLNFV